MKAGTTSLYEYLRRHPQVYMSERKELDFFALDEAWARGLAWYESCFESSTGRSAVGEASTSYTKFPTYPDVAARVAATLPTVRLVYVVRDPIERIRSQYTHEVWLGQETRRLEDAIRADPRYIDYSRYWMQIQRYLQHFPESQLIVITSDCLRSAREATVAQVLEFIGVDPLWRDDVIAKDYHVSSGKRRPMGFTRRLPQFRLYRALSRVTPTPFKALNDRFLTRPLAPEMTWMSPESHRYVADCLTEDIRALSEYLGPGFHGWGLT